MNYPLEYEICKQSVMYFIEKYLGLDLIDSQIDDINHILDMDNSDHYDITSGRGSGTTTTLLIVALWLVLFNPGSKIAICCKTYFLLMNNKKLIERLYEKFYSEFSSNDNTVQMIESNSSWRIKFTNKSELYYISDVRNGLRGINLDYILLDNTDYPENYGYMYSRVVNVTTL